MQEKEWFTTSSLLFPPHHLLLPYITVLFHRLLWKTISARLQPQLHLLVTVLTSQLSPTLPPQHLVFLPIEFLQYRRAAPHRPRNLQIFHYHRAILHATQYSRQKKGYQNPKSQRHSQNRDKLPVARRVEACHTRTQNDRWHSRIVIANVLRWTLAERGFGPLPNRGAEAYIAILAAHAGNLFQWATASVGPTIISPQSQSPPMYQQHPPEASPALVLPRTYLPIAATGPSEPYRPHLFTIICCSPTEYASRIRCVSSGP